MVNLQIKYVNNETIAFNIDNDLFYLKFGPNIPQLFDASAILLSVSNIDTWLCVKTHQRYSFQSLQDMAIAFSDGLHVAYDLLELNVVCENSTLTTIKVIMQREWLYDYVLIYWIESLGLDETEKYLKTLRNKFDDIIIKIGSNKLYNYLCRILKMCTYRQSHNADICEKLIKRMGREPSEPTYPNTSKIDKEVLLKVKSDVFRSLCSKYKGVPNNIVEVVDAIQSGRILK